MAGNSFGTLFRISTFGESHGKAIGVIIDGCPPGIPIDEELINTEMARRRPGQSTIVTQRKEKDAVKILSGVFEGTSTGTPICLMIMNEDQRSKDYRHIATSFRPSHADYTYHVKYGGHRDYRGGGRSSARETAARVAAGAIAKSILLEKGLSIHAYVSQVGGVVLDTHPEKVDLTKIESNDVRCPDALIAQEMIDLIKKIKKSGDTIGGVVTCIAKDVPPGLGEPVFDKLHADLGKAILSINACKGFEYGSGFSGVEMKGSEHNDHFYQESGRVMTKTNFSGGIQGGISNGAPIFFRAAFKPVATIIPDQESIDEQGQAVTVGGRGRHDPCVVPRAVPIVEAMTALTLVDHFMRYEAIKP